MAKRLNFGFVFSLVLCVVFSLTLPQAKAYEHYPHPDRTFFPSQSDIVYISDLQKRTFDGFIKQVGRGDQFFTEKKFYKGQEKPFICTACIGFQLVAYAIGAERHYITRTQAVMGTLYILRHLSLLPQNDTLEKGSGYRGFFYSYLDPKTGLRAPIEGNDISTQDNSFLQLGILFTRQYYMQDVSSDDEIRRLSDKLFEQVQWPFMLKENGLLASYWNPQDKYSDISLEGYNEGLAAYLLAMGSPSYPLSEQLWKHWTARITQNWQPFEGEEYFNAVPLSSHLLAHAWIDFRGIKDDTNRERGLDYAENTRRAVIAQRRYGISNPMKWKNYSDILWGLTTSDGPGGGQSVPQTQGSGDGQRRFMGEAVRGVSHEIIIDDGTISPAIMAASLPFAPKEIFSSLHGLHAYYGRELDGGEGLVSAVNPSYEVEDHTHKKKFWISHEWQIGQQGLALLMIENWRDRVVWNAMKTSPVICRGLMKAGFRGGWLEKHYLTVEYDNVHHHPIEQTGNRQNPSKTPVN